MARKITKGPWEFHLGIDYAVVMGKDQTTEDALARLYGRSEEVEANGALIAGSPDLLAAAKLALRHVIAPLAAGTKPSPQMLGKAHEELFQAIRRADPNEYGASHAERIAAEQAGS